MKIRMGDLLMRAGVITESQLRNALEEQRRWGGRIGDILVRMQYVSEDVFVRALSRQTGVPRAELDRAPEPEALARLFSETALEYEVLPLELKDSGRTLVLATSDPLNLPALDHLRRITGCRIASRIAGPGALRRHIAKHYGGQVPADDAAHWPQASALDSAPRADGRAPDQGPSAGAAAGSPSAPPAARAPPPAAPPPGRGLPPPPQPVAPAMPMRAAVGAGSLPTQSLPPPDAIPPPTLLPVAAQPVQGPMPAAGVQISGGVPLAPRTQMQASPMPAGTATGPMPPPPMPRGMTTMPLPGQGPAMPAAAAHPGGPWNLPIGTPAAQSFVPPPDDRLLTVEETQRRDMAALRALVEMLADNGVIRLDEYLARLRR